MDILDFLLAGFSGLGLIVLILTVVAMWLVGRPNRFAFIVFTVAQALQIYIFYVDKRGFLILTMIALIIFNVINYYRWKKEGVG